MHLQLSCAFATATASPEHAAVAEELGYRRAYFYDSPALFPDVWGQLYRAADRTERIILGSAVLVPSNRHVMTNAAAIAGLVDIVGQHRVSIAVGSGRTGRLGLGQRPMRWEDVASYTRAVLALLRGETVEWDNRRIRMMHSPGHGASRPIRVELLVAAAGPKGIAVAHELGDGAFGGLAPIPGFDRSPALAWGTVLEPGERPEDARVLAAAGPAAATFGGHYPIQFGAPDDDSERVAEWRSAYEDVAPDELHTYLHEGHLCAVNRRDHGFVTAELIDELGLAGDRDGWRLRLLQLEAAGASEIVYQPAGPDIAGELERFAAMAAE
ncbi:MAG: 5,10-methylenetetrahydromethanopterin reductase [Mycobacterium sp.]|uniref:LLM class flavin-dependent oxidoreductase n=1 Tax=Mycobacterium sp. TaxID=1785 RepID=UPI0028B3DDC3|nr:LLM class flavin-dependent oxidoreductase [Mycobacterium sp.]MDT5115807.1 5,10-methylenetetrahydromethanopterin reductase [Mycobacterium sp.]